MTQDTRNAPTLSWETPPQQYQPWSQQSWSQQPWDQQQLDEHAQWGGPTPPERRRTDWRDWTRVGVASLAAAALAAGATWTLATASDDNAAVATTSSTVAAAPASEAGDHASVAAAVRDSVVAISTASRAGSGLGSGVILDPDGNVLTNHHVIAGAEEIQVTLADGRILPAEVVGTDESTDLAVVRMLGAPDDLTAARLGNSEGLVVGQEVMAVGNPLGLSSTVTTGIISALDRPVTTTDASGSGGTVVVTNAIQVDAAINPGNSGGPVFDMNGHVIGIASSIATLSQGSSGSIGLGFAIPVDLAQRVADEIIADGTATHALLGVSMSDAVVEVDGTRRTGAQVQRVVAGSAAAEAGLEAGDVIVTIDGEPVSGSEALTGYVRQYTPGESVGLEVVRRGTAETVTATLGAVD
ncbi:MAG: S1C family serine protease [Actinomycetota bacterium]